jgi:hypothetical protein
MPDFISIMPHKKVVIDMPSFSGKEGLYFYWHEKSLVLAKFIADRAVVGVNFKDKGIFVKYYKQYLSTKIAHEIRPLIQSDSFCDNLIQKNRRFNGKSERLLSGYQYAKSVMLRGYAIYYVIVLLVKGWFKFHPAEMQKCNVLFFPYHKNWVKDPEIDYLLNNTIGSKVVLSNRDKLVDVLEGNQVVSDKVFYFRASDLTHIFEVLVGIIRGFFSRKEIYDALAMYLYKKSYYIALLNVVSPSLIAPVRGDTLKYSSILRSVANNRNVPVFSWSHSVYSYLEYYLSGVDFDYYAASNPSELLLYKKYWSKECVYSFVGQVSYPSIDNISLNTTGLERFDGFNGIFSTTIDSRVLSNTLDNYSEFVDAVVLSSNSISGGFFYKSKNNYKIERGEIIEYEAQQAEEYSLSQFRLIDDKFEIIEDGITVKDVVPFINIAFVYSMSTVAFELIQEKVKVIIFWPFDSVELPLSKMLPLLVAKDANEMINNAELLDKMSASDYVEYLSPYFDSLSFSMSDERSMLLQAIDNALEDTNRKIV